MRSQGVHYNLHHVSKHPEQNSSNIICEKDQSSRRDNSIVPSVSPVADIVRSSCANVSSDTNAQTLNPTESFGLRRRRSGG